MRGGVTTPVIAWAALLYLAGPSPSPAPSASAAANPRGGGPISPGGVLNLGVRRALRSMSREATAASPAAAGPDPARAGSVRTRAATALSSTSLARRLTVEEVTEAATATTGVETEPADRNHLLSSFLAGIGSGALASVACAPLDLVRTRMQVMGEIRGAAGAGGAASEAAARLPSLSVYRALADIIRQDGFRGCFRGLGATLATVPMFWGIYFPLYETLKRDLHEAYDNRRGIPLAERGECPALVHMSSAILAGAVADFVCNPMFLVRTRMQTEALHYYERPVAERKPHGVWRTVRSLHAEGGVPVFWRGLTASLMGLSHVAIQFPVYEFLKAEARSDSPTNEETAADLLLASGISKMCASVVTYPHEVIRSRMMDARGPHVGQNVMQTLRRVVRNEGYASLYTGLHVSLLRVVPNCCITFMSYELILRWAKEHALR